MHYMNDKSKSVEYFLFHLLQDTTLTLSSLPYLNSLISEFFQHYETSMEADDVFLHGRNIVMCSHAPSKTTFYKFPLRGKAWLGIKTPDTPTHCGTPRRRLVVLRRPPKGDTTQVMDSCKGEYNCAPAPAVSTKCIPQPAPQIHPPVPPPCRWDPYSPSREI